MKSVFIVHHVHEFEDGHEDHKIIGVFTTQEAAAVALAQVKDQPGFKECLQGFEITEWQLNRVGWPEGYVTIYPGE
jgi:hypothetical protein